MQLPILLLILGILALLAFRQGRNRALGSVEHPAQLRSLPGYYGAYAVLWCALPSLLFLGAWLIVEPSLVHQLLVSGLPPEVQQLPQEQLSLYVNDVKNL
ncbi:MAG: phosphate ABC transporter permease family protein, partial [Acidobacteria bacterium]|nr:phosphate ABC transporter permease family protein [Acidobacteriota bacterium]